MRASSAPSPSYSQYPKNKFFAFGGVPGGDTHHEYDDDERFRGLLDPVDDVNDNQQINNVIVAATHADFISDVTTS